jgi:hypothetical protein
MASASLAVVVSEHAASDHRIFQQWINGYVASL